MWNRGAPGPYLVIGESDLPPEVDRRLPILLEYWRSKRAGRRFPSRADLDPLDIPTALPYLTLVELRPEPPGFFYRLVGTAAVEVLTRDPTGLAVGTGVKADEIEVVLNRYRYVRDKGVALYHRARTQEENNDYTLIDRLMLPLGEGEDVTKILSLIIKVKS